MCATHVHYMARATDLSWREQQISFVTDEKMLCGMASHMHVHMR